MKNYHKNILAMLTGILFFVLFLILLEMCGQAFYFFKHGHTYKQSLLFVKNDSYGYSNNLDYKAEEYPNMYKGYRSKKFNIAELNSKIKVICVGGSTTFGYLNRDNETFPYFLQERFDAFQNSGYFVLNAGVVGFNILQIEKILDKIIVEIKPDIVVINNLFNNFNFNGGKYSWYPINVALDSLGFIDKSKAFLLSNSVLYAKLQQSLFNKSLRTGNWDGIDAIYKSSLRQSDLKLYRDTLVRIFSKLKSNNIKTVLVKEPLYITYKDEAEKQFIASKLGKNAFEKYESLFLNYNKYLSVLDSIKRDYNEIILVNAEETFESLPPAKRSELFNDIAHLSSEGNKLLASEIFKEIVQNK